MAKLTIIGNANPVIGKLEMYTISDFNDWLSLNNTSFKPPLKVPKIEWGIMVQLKNGWVRAEKNNKDGKTVPYTFGQKSLTYKGIKIVVQKGEDKGELIIHPQRAKESKITKVELLDGNVPKGYGKQIFLKVLDKETFLAHYKKYSKLYPKLEYETIGSFSKDNDIILHYAHLRKIYVKKGWIISNVDIPIGETGVSGVIQGGKPDGTCAPHLHFEIRNMNKERINPGFFINFNSYDTMSDAEKKLQQSTAKNGKIKEFSGAKDTYKTEKDYE